MAKIKTRPNASKLWLNSALQKKVKESGYYHLKHPSASTSSQKETSEKPYSTSAFFLIVAIAKASSVLPEK